MAGYGKAVGALAAGFATTIVFGVLHQVWQVTLDAEVQAATQGLLTLILVYWAPHGGDSA